MRLSDGPALVALTRTASRPPAADAVHRRASLGGVAVIATTAAAGIAGPPERAQAASLSAAPRTAPIVATTPRPAQVGTTPAGDEETPSCDKRRVAPPDSVAPEATQLEEAPNTTPEPEPGLGLRPPPPSEAETTTAPPSCPPSLKTRPPRHRHTDTAGSAPYASRTTTAACPASARGPTGSGSAHPERGAQLQRGSEQDRARRRTALSRSPAGRPPSHRDPRASRRKP